MKTEDLKQLVALIRKVEQEDLEVVILAIRKQQKRIQEDKADSFRVGDLVEFFANKRGRTIRGRIQKINRQTISLHQTEAPFTLWRVSPSLLRLVGKHEVA